MRVVYGTEPMPGGINEDYVVIGPDWFVLLDGATAPMGIDSGCIHNVAWLVAQLAGAIAHSLAISTEPLADILAAAIDTVCAAHADTCDIGNPASPSATVALLRVHNGQFDYLVLSDSVVLFDTGNEVNAIVDDRVDYLPSYRPEDVRALRNQPGGFWVASTKPEAAYQAITGSVPVVNVHRAALLSDGASRYVDRFALGNWSDLLDILEGSGPAELIHRIRHAEQAEPEEKRQIGQRRIKQHDDATAIFLCR